MKKCEGHGQSSCFNCTKNGKWSLTWTSFLYHIDNDEHMYCYECAKELEQSKVGD